MGGRGCFDGCSFEGRREEASVYGTSFLTILPLCDPERAYLPALQSALTDSPSKPADLALHLNHRTHLTTIRALRLRLPRRRIPTLPARPSPPTPSAGRRTGVYWHVLAFEERDCFELDAGDG